MTLRGGAYLILCSENDRVYVGSSQDTAGRWSQHKCLLRSGAHHSAQLQSDWQKFGSQAFTLEVVARSDSRSERLAIEQSLLDDLQPFGDRGYNTAPHSDSTREAKRTPDQVERMAAFFRGRPISDAHRAAISRAIKGRRHTPEAREKMRQHASAHNPQVGKPLTDAQKAVLHRKGQDHSWFGRKHSEQTKRTLALAHGHPIEQIDPAGAVVARFNSAAEAATALGLKGPASILRAANHGRKSCGFAWRKAS